MVSACVNLKANTHFVNSRKDNIFRQDGGFLGERLKGSLNYSPWIINQLALSLSTQERVKKAKPGVVSAVLTSSTTKESVVSPILLLDPFYTFELPVFMILVSMILTGVFGSTLRTKKSRLQRRIVLYFYWRLGEILSISGM